MMAQIRTGFAFEGAWAPSEPASPTDSVTEGAFFLFDSSVIRHRLLLNRRGTALADSYPSSHGSATTLPA